MISYLQGKVIFKGEKFVILDVNGVGYKVFLSRRTLNKLPEIGRYFKCFCYLNVRETALDLYGFLTEEELELFEILESIPGVGPKAALEISSLGPLEKLKKAIAAGDEKIFEEISGIGRKKARAIILELSGRLKEIEKQEKPKKNQVPEQALINLGFSRQQTREALSQIPEDIQADEQKIKEALKILGK